MPVISNTGTATPVTNAETTVATIAGGPFDNVSVYFEGGVGGGGGALLLAIYATVNGLLTRVGQSTLTGTNNPTLVDWTTEQATFNNGVIQTEQIVAGGSAYTITVIDLSTRLAAPGQPARQPVTVTIAGNNQFDTVASVNRGQLFTLTPGQIGTLPILPGYAQFMDVGCEPMDLPTDVLVVTVFADCGPGSIVAPLVDVNIPGSSNELAGVFRNLRLPVAVNYTVNVVNQSTKTASITLTACTYSLSVTAGGSIILGGDTTGPSAANTVVAWDNHPLDLVTFGGPANAAIPVYDLALNEWRTEIMSGGATMTNTGVVTIAPGTIVTLGGDVTGPSNTNTVIKWDNVPLLTGAVAASFDLGQLPNAGIPIFDTATGHWRSFVLSGNATMTSTGVVTVTSGGAVTLGGDVTGPSGANTVVRWDNVPLLTGAVAGSFNLAQIPNAGVSIFDTGTGHWRALALSGGATMTSLGVVTVNPAATITLAGDVTGPSGANTVVRWDNVPLLTGAVASSFDLGQLPDAAVAVFDLATGHWRAVPLSGGATMTNSGVVTVPAAGVTLGGDVTGPAGANTVVRWDNVPLLTGAVAASFDLGQLPDAAVSIFDIGTGHWRALALSGGATMTDAGVVTINPAASITLGGDVTGPSGANTVVRWDNVPLLTGAVAGSLDLGQLSDGGIPIFDTATGHWRSFVLSGGATMTDAGVVTITGVTPAPPGFFNQQYIVSATNILAPSGISTGIHPVTVSGVGGGGAGGGGQGGASAGLAGFGGGGGGGAVENEITVMVDFSHRIDAFIAAQAAGGLAGAGGGGAGGNGVDGGTAYLFDFTSNTVLVSFAGGSGGRGGASLPSLQPGLGGANYPPAQSAGSLGAATGANGFMAAGGHGGQQGVAVPTSGNFNDTAQNRPLDVAPGALQLYNPGVAGTNGAALQGGGGGGGGAGPLGDGTAGGNGNAGTGTNGVDGALGTGAGSGGGAGGALTGSSAGSRGGIGGGGSITVTVYTT